MSTDLVSPSLSFDGVLKTPSFDFFWVVVLKIWAFLTYFIYLSVMGRYKPSPSPPSKLSWNTKKMPISSKLPLKSKRLFSQIKFFFNLYSKTFYYKSARKVHKIREKGPAHSQYESDPFKVHFSFSVPSEYTSESRILVELLINTDSEPTKTYAPKTTILHPYT